MAKDPGKLIPPTPSAADYQVLRAAPQAEDEAAMTAFEDQTAGGRDADPYAIFADWLSAAVAKEPRDANAMTLATADADGWPDARMVLLKDVSDGGFVFYTNTESRKGRHLGENPRAALLFHWKSLGRQVRIQGSIAPVTPEEADAYFASRARDSQIGAWASDQSRTMDGPLALEGRVAKFAAKFGLGAVPRPPHWSGYRLTPRRIEFWRERPFRLHERRVFERDAGDGAWAVGRLYP